MADRTLPEPVKVSAERAHRSVVGLITIENARQIHC
jgi:hypothetical protein